MPAWRGLRAARIAVTLWLVAATVGAGVHGPALFRPSSELPAHPEPGVLRAVTWNLGDRIADPSRATERLRDLDADLVGLQEVARGVRDRIERDLASTYPTRLDLGEGLEGTMLLAKLPLVRREDVAPPGFRPVLRARLRDGAAEVEVLVVHLSPRTALLGSATRRGTDVQVLVAAAPPGRSSILLGDLNATRRNGAFEKLLEAGWRDAFAESGRGAGLTFPIPGRWRSVPLGPLVGIDHVLHGPDFEAVGASVCADGGSDHLPVAADLRRRSG